MNNYSQQTEAGPPFDAAAGYAARVFFGMAEVLSDWDRPVERQPLTAALKRSMRTKNPNRPNKGNNARAVNAKATKRAAKEAKRARHNDGS